MRDTGGQNPADLRRWPSAPNGSRNRRENDGDQHEWPVLVLEEEVLIE